MAQSPSHKIGQIIGNLVERSVRPCLEGVAQTRNLYFDYQGKPRPGRRGRKVKWEDHYGNAHDLDYVMERGGSDTEVGIPVAFIEVAWRRYTKHSRNKAQEIQGAVRPLAERYRHSSPFLGAVLAGEFTQASVEQLRSLGFHVLYFPYATLIDAFDTEGIDVRYDEDTPDDITQMRVETAIAMRPEATTRVEKSLIRMNQDEVELFRRALVGRIDRKVDKVIIVPLYGVTSQYRSPAEARRLLGQGEEDRSRSFHMYEVCVQFTDGDLLYESFRNQADVSQFLLFLETQVS